MTQEAIESAQKLDTDGSEYIELFILEYVTGSYAYFYNGGYEDLGAQTPVKMRDTVGGTIRDYVPVPIDIEGMKFESDGAIFRPTLTIANIAAVFSTNIGDMDYEELIGARVTKRTTLRKYLYDSNTANPPIEFPIQKYNIDRIQQKNILNVVFELASPIDIQNVTVPTRQVIGGACPWQYQGAAQNKTDANKVGGCSWRTDYQITWGGVNYNIYVNKKDEYIVPHNLIQASTSSPVAGNFYTYSKDTSLIRVNSNGSRTAGQSKVFQLYTATALGATPTDSNSTIVRKFKTYSASDTYYAYTDTDFNDYVLHNNILWQVKNVTQTGGSHTVAPEAGNYWQRGDQCGKKLTSCAKRFGATGKSSTVSSVTIKHVNPDIQSNYAVLPFGGFPGSRRFV